MRAPTPGITVLTLNRPEQRNALSAALRGRTDATPAELVVDDGIGAVVGTGVGEVFCAGRPVRFPMRLYGLPISGLRSAT